jgi:hypothetical protein
LNRVVVHYLNKEKGLDLWEDEEIILVDFVDELGETEEGKDDYQVFFFCLRHLGGDAVY